MGYREAVDIFMRLAKSRQRTAEEVAALEMGARQMCRRHFQRQRNWARRREAANEGREDDRAHGGKAGVA